MTRSPLRWAGSKRQSLPGLIARAPTNYSKYIEPFVGSACLAFYLGPKQLALGDLNPRLIEFYHFLKNEPDELHRRYLRLSGDPDAYYVIRREYNSSPSSIDRAAKFLYLNRHCFNGIYRVNSKGEFNVPWGGQKAGSPLGLEVLRSASSKLSNAQIECADFEKFIDDHLCRDAFVYLDPPYARNEERVFREYHENSFATCDWERLLRILTKINDAGATFLLSYAGDPSLMEELSKWNVGFKSSRRKYREFMASNRPLSA